jgi:CRISPR type III-A-associated RAMP protein Csm4
MLKIAITRILTPIKIGRGEDYVDSMTLYRALMNIMIKLGHEDAAKDLFLNGGITLSSLLPILNMKSKRILFLRAPPIRLGCNDRRLEKEVKNAKYLDYELMIDRELNLTGGLRVTDCNKKDDTISVKVQDMDATVINGFIISNENYNAVKDSEIEKLLREPRHEVRYRNVIDRVTNAAVPFATATVMPMTEMAILMQIRKEGFESHIKDALKVLGEVGIGGERSVGYGRFELVDFTDFGDDLGSVRIKLGSESAYYVTGRTLIEDNSNYLASRFEVISGFAGDLLTAHLPLLVLLPAGSIVTRPKHYRDYVDKNQALIIDPLLIPTQNQGY